MKSSMDKIVATLSFDCDAEPAFWGLAPLVCGCLRKADIAILQHTLGLDGMSMEFETDHGRIELAARGGFGAPAYLDISADIDCVCPRELARQICFLLSSHISAQHSVRAIHWTPSRQTLTPRAFRWGVLRDRPHPLAAWEHAADRPV